MFWLCSQLKALLTAHLQLACHLQASFFIFHSPVNGVSTYMQHSFKFSLREGTLGSQVPLQLVWHHVSISQFSQHSVRAVDTPVPTEVICNSLDTEKKGIHFSHHLLCSSSRNVVTPVCPQAKKVIFFSPSFASLLLFSEGAGIVKIKADLKGNQSKC